MSVKCSYEFNLFLIVFTSCTLYNNSDIHNICSINSHYSIKDSRITEIAIDPAAITECESIMSHKTMYYEDPFAAISWVDGVIKAQKV